MPAEEDLDAFEAFEAMLACELESRNIASFVAVMTFKGKRDHLLYLDERCEAEAYSLVTPYLDALSRFRPQVELSEDPERTQWRDLLK